MAVSVRSVEHDAVILLAPLAPNINHRDTVFGGSASALAILAAWSLLHVRLRAEGITGRLVIQRNSMEYERPVSGRNSRTRWRARAGAASMCRRCSSKAIRLLADSRASSSPGVRLAADPQRFSVWRFTASAAAAMAAGSPR